MGRLAIIEDDSATSVAAEASNKTSPDKSETKTSSATETTEASALAGSGSGKTNGPATTTHAADDGTNAVNAANAAVDGTKRCFNKKLTGGVSDESGYYDEDGEELEGDDSIEIVYDRISDRNNRLIMQQNAANAAAAAAANAANVMKNTHQLVSSTTTGAVSITPIPVSSTVHQPASSNYVQGRKIFIYYYYFTLFDTFVNVFLIKIY